MIQRAEPWWNGAQNALSNGLSFDLVVVLDSRLKVSAQMPGYDWLALPGGTTIFRAEILRRYCDVAGIFWQYVLRQDRWGGPVTRKKAVIFWRFRQVYKMAVLLRREAGIVFSVAPPSAVPGTAKYGGTSHEHQETALICTEKTREKSRRTR